MLLFFLFRLPDSEHSFVVRTIYMISLSGQVNCNRNTLLSAFEWLRFLKQLIWLCVCSSPNFYIILESPLYFLSLSEALLILINLHWCCCKPIKQMRCWAIGKPEGESLSGGLEMRERVLVCLRPWWGAQTPEEPMWDTKCKCCSLDGKVS